MHITDDTLNLLDNQFEVEEFESRDPFLQEHRLKTYLIVRPTDSDAVERPSSESERPLERKKSVCQLKKSNKWTECGVNADKGFASEQIIKKNVTQTVSPPSNPL